MAAPRLLVRPVDNVIAEHGAPVIPPSPESIPVAFGEFQPPQVLQSQFQQPTQVLQPQFQQPPQVLQPQFQQPPQVLQPQFQQPPQVLQPPPPAPPQVLQPPPPAPPQVPSLAPPQAPCETPADEDDEKISRPRPPLKVVPKVMARPRASNDPNDRSGRGGRGRQADLPKTLDQKQAEYIAARARIFGAEAGTGLDEGDDAAANLAMSGSGGDRGAGGAGGQVKAHLRNRGPDSGYDPDYNRNVPYAMGMRGCPGQMPPGGCPNGGFMPNGAMPPQAYMMNGGCPGGVPFPCCPGGCGFPQGMMPAGCPGFPAGFNQPMVGFPLQGMPGNFPQGMQPTAPGGPQMAMQQFASNQAALEALAQLGNLGPGPDQPLIQPMVGGAAPQMPAPQNRSQLLGGPPGGSGPSGGCGCASSGASSAPNNGLGRGAGGGGGSNGSGAGRGINRGVMQSSGRGGGGQLWGGPMFGMRGQSGPHLPRERVLEERLRGTVLEWKGKYGWIQSDEPVDHPGAARRGGKIFISMQDIVSAERLDHGDIVEFFLFEDNAGLGAEDCRLAREGSARRVSFNFNEAPEPESLPLPLAGGGGN